jgi:hypothetical protein
MMQPSKVRRHAHVKKRHFQQSMAGRGVSLVAETIDFIPASCVLKPLRDQMIVEPIDVVHSRVLIVPPHTSKLVRGKVLAIGPGHYPLIYMDKDGNRGAPRGKRAKIAWGEVFVPTEVKVGDIVHLDGRNTGKTAFDAFYWGTKYCLHAREADVAGVEDHS